MSLQRPPPCVLNLPPCHPSPLPNLEPCTPKAARQRLASPRHDPAEGGSGPQPSAAAGPAQRSSGPMAHTPARSDWTQQRGHSLDEQPGEGTGGSERKRVDLRFLHSKVRTGQLVLYFPNFYYWVIGAHDVQNTTKNHKTCEEVGR